MKNNKRNKLSIDKYNYGSYVIVNQQNPNNIPTVNTAENAVSGATTGASLGSSIAGPVGGLIGAGVGAIGGLFTAGKRRRQRREQIAENNANMLGDYRSQFDSMIDTVNENPYGTYQDGGDVALTEINIEQGELQIDPESGKIMREYTGINPETGGLYKPHAKGNKKDSKDNIVTAEEGSFIITKDKAKKYKDAIDNNDKLAQNSIMHNIRKNKRKSLKFQTGGLIEPLTGFAGITPNTTLNTGPSTLGNLNLNVQRSTPVTPATPSFDWGNLGSNLLDYAPGILNMVQGLGSPDTLSRSRTPINPFRSQTLSNMPEEINYSPLFARAYRDRNNAYDIIDETTNSSAVARANKLNVMANTQRGIQDAFFQGEDYNNRIRTQRAGLFNQLGEQDLNRFNQDRSFNYQVDLTNRQMQEGRRQQFNYGLSQLGQMREARRTNARLEDRDQMLEQLLSVITPALDFYRNNNGGTNGNR